VILTGRHGALVILAGSVPQGGSGRIDLDGGADGRPVPTAVDLDRR